MASAAQSLYVRGVITLDKVTNGYGWRVSCSPRRRQALHPHRLVPALPHIPDVIYGPVPQARAPRGPRRRGAERLDPSAIETQLAAASKLSVGDWHGAELIFSESGARAVECGGPRSRRRRFGPRAVYRCVARSFARRSLIRFPAATTVAATLRFGRGHDEVMIARRKRSGSIPPTVRRHILGLCHEAQGQFDRAMSPPCLAASAATWVTPMRGRPHRRGAAVA